MKVSAKKTKKNSFPGNLVSFETVWHINKFGTNDDASTSSSPTPSPPLPYVLTVHWKGDGRKYVSLRHASAGFGTASRSSMFLIGFSNLPLLNIPFKGVYWD